jgi:hypothetical protein|tara:strand:- start:609 stop:1106 length:498 start_codon:yes stop_codon:yes gene_type:complete
MHKRFVIFSYNKENDTILVRIAGCPDINYYMSNGLNQNMRTWNNKETCWAILPMALTEVAANVAISPNPEFIRYDKLKAHQVLIVETIMSKFGKRQSRASNVIIGASKINGTARSILCVTEKAPIEVIKAAHKALAKKYHPDMQGGNVKKFRQVQEAYEKLVPKR